MEALPGTLMLASVTIVMLLVIAVPMGVIAAIYQNKWPDYLFRGIAIYPVFPYRLSGLVLCCFTIFGYKLGIAPIADGNRFVKKCDFTCFYLGIYVNFKIYAPGTFGSFGRNQ